MICHTTATMTMLLPSLFCFAWVLVFFLNLFCLEREVARTEGGYEREQGKKLGLECMMLNPPRINRSFKKQAQIFEELQVTAAVHWVKQKNSNIKKTHWVFSSQDVFLNMYSEIKKFNQKYRILSLTYLITECHTNKFLFTIKIFLI